MPVFFIHHLHCQDEDSKAGNCPGCWEATEPSLVWSGREHSAVVLKEKGRMSRLGRSIEHKKLPVLPLTENVINNTMKVDRNSQDQCDSRDRFSSGSFPGPP